MTPPNPYSSIDSVIQTWSNANSLTMFNSFAGREARFCYKSSPRGECFQISIQAPQDGTVTVDAWTIETLDDRELHESWVVPVFELPETLEAALNKLRDWLEG